MLFSRSSSVLATQTHSCKGTDSTGRAATPYRGAAHHLTKGKSSDGTPPRGPWGKDYLEQRLLCGDGGSPEGAAVDGLNSAAPSGPLCFFLRVEKEDLAQMTSCI